MRPDTARSLDWAELALYGGAGGLAGLLPDIFEPATDPNHRRFFHSMIFGGGAIYATHGEHSAKWDSNSRAFVQALSWCYLSHLGGDATTPRGIPII